MEPLAALSPRASRYPAEPDTDGVATTGEAAQCRDIPGGSHAPPDDSVAGIGAREAGLQRNRRVRAPGSGPEPAREAALGQVARRCGGAGGGPGEVGWAARAAQA